MYFSRARLLLRKKKHQETLLERTDKQLDNLEQLTHDIEFAQVERQVLDGLKSGNEVRNNHLFPDWQSWQKTKSKIYRWYVLFNTSPYCRLWRLPTECSPSRRSNPSWTTRRRPWRNNGRSMPFSLDREALLAIFATWKYFFKHLAATSNHRK